MLSSIFMIITNLFIIRKGGTIQSSISFKANGVISFKANGVISFKANGVC
jgi:hypothetical protein